ncbi:hypothetical protein DFH09DRAFT_1099207 [Mycena vulgaris]|nr:hypothetical protein DFH09DRAFT_1099207 [Mycena vulgaris]
MPQPRPKVGPSIDFCIHRFFNIKKFANTSVSHCDKKQNHPKKGTITRSCSRTSATNCQTEANKNAVWTGATPKGPPKKDPKPSESGKQKRKRTESSATEDSKSKARRKDGRESPEEEDPMPPNTRLKKRAGAEVIASDDEGPAPKSHKKDSVKSAVAAEELLDGDNADSEPENHQGGIDYDREEDAEGADDDNLENLEATGDSDAALAMETPIWTTQDDEDFPATVTFEHLRTSRSSSRASMSSGHMGVPSSDVSSDSESDAETKAVFRSLKTAQQLVPAPPLKKKASSARGTWNKPAPLKAQTKMRSNASSSRSIPSHPKIKLEDGGHSLPAQLRHAVKKEDTRDRNVLRSSSPEVIEIDESSDDDVQVYNNNDIQLVITDRKIGLKQQHPRVEKTAQLGVDYYLGYYLWKKAFPSTEQKTNFAFDALVNAAHTLRFEDIKKRLMIDATYRTSLGSVLHGRVSAFRLKAKTATDMTVVGNHGLRGNTEDRVTFLIAGMCYLYPLSRGGIDPKSGKPGPDVIDNERPYLAEGITNALSQAFFKGTPSIASKYSELFVAGNPKDPKGRKQVPASMVALVHASLNEYRSGRHLASKFEGNSLQEIYNTHLLLLDTICKSGKLVLEDLYTIVTEGSHLSDVARKPMAMEALALLGI